MRRPRFRASRRCLDRSRYLVADHTSESVVQNTREEFTAMKRGYFWPNATVLGDVHVAPTGHVTTDAEGP